MGLNAAALGLPVLLQPPSNSNNDWPSYRHERAPEFLRRALEAAPKLTLDRSGYLVVHKKNGPVQVPLATTQWNKERRYLGDRLESGKRWAIVLHWFGDNGPEDQRLDAYLRGFDSIRPVFNYQTRTSAHFLVGNTHPAEVRNRNLDIGVVQTQSPDSDGTPLIASHLQALDYTAHWEKRQYFVRAYYQLAQLESGSTSVLQELFDSPNVIDPNARSIAIEVSGHDFDGESTFPGIQKIANTAALVWALMRRYQIRANDVLGHHEIQLGKADPGKKFMTLIRYLIGFLALRDRDALAYELVFGGFSAPGQASLEAVKRYFNFIRNYLVLVGTPHQVYEWESVSNFWLAYDAMLSTRTVKSQERSRFIPPVSTGQVHGESGYLVPENHEGVDYTNSEKTTPVKLITAGQCLYANDTLDPHWGKMALFRHRQEDGAEIVAVYGHLESLADVKTGIIYPQNFPVGQIQRPNSYQDAYLHFAIAYGATWDTDLSRMPFPPPNAGISWILPRYLDPLAYLKEQTKPLPLSKKGNYYE